MAGSVNKAIIIGNLGADPEIRRGQDGRSIANLRVATSESWRDKQSGERRERTEWHRVTIFNEGLAKVAEQYLKKGTKVYIEGQIETRKWKDQSGQDRYSTEIVLRAFRGELQMLSGQGDGAANQSNSGYSGARSSAPASGGSAPMSTGTQRPGSGVGSDMDDEIPFAPEWRG